MNDGPVSGAQKHDHKDSQDESGNTVSDQNDQAGDGVETGFVFDRLSDSENDADAVYEEETRYSKGSGNRKFFYDQFQDRLVPVKRIAEFENEKSFPIVVIRQTVPKRSVVVFRGIPEEGSQIPFPQGTVEIVDFF